MYEKYFYKTSPLLSHITNGGYAVVIYLFFDYIQDYILYIYMVYRGVYII